MGDLRPAEADDAKHAMIGENKRYHSLILRK
jgi:hypothetical protein